MTFRSPFQARFFRRPILFWWQPFALVGMTALLFSELRIPSPAPRTPPPQTSAVAYVTLDPEYAAQRFKRSLAAWTAGREERQNIPGLDLRALDSGKGLGAPEFLEQSSVFPSDRPPLALAALPATLSAIAIPPYTPHQQPAPPKPQEGLFIAPSPALTAAGFAFTFPAEELKALRSGECRFYVETGPEGNVLHTLLLSAPAPTTLPIERALMRGRAQGAASGTVTIRWSYTK